MVFTI